MPENIRPRAAVEAFIDGLPIDASNIERYEAVLALPHAVYVEVINRLIDGAISMDDLNPALAERERSATGGVAPIDFGELLDSFVGSSRDPDLSDRENVALQAALGKIDGGGVPVRAAVLPISRSEARYNMEVSIAEELGVPPPEVDLSGTILNSGEEALASDSPEVANARRSLRAAGDRMDEVLARAGADPDNGTLASMARRSSMDFMAAKETLRLALSRNGR